MSWVKLSPAAFAQLFDPFWVNECQLMLELGPPVAKLWVEVQPVVVVSHFAPVPFSELCCHLFLRRTYRRQ